MQKSKQGAPPSSAPTPWPAQFPDEAIAIERNKVNGAFAVVLLTSFAFSPTAWSLFEAGRVTSRPGFALFVMVFGVDATSPTLAGIIFGASMLSILTAIAMGATRSFVAGVVTLAAVLTATVASLVAGGWLTGALGVVCSTLVFSGVRALWRIPRIIDIEARRNPLVAHYRLLIRLLTRTMAADQKIDRREVESIARICDSLRIAHKVQRQFLDEALDEIDSDQAPSLEELTRQYLELAREAGLLHPERTALMASLAVAGADEEIHEAERTEILALGDALGLDRAAVTAEIAAHRSRLEEMTPQMARELLTVDADAEATEIEEAHRRLTDDLDTQDFGHLGAALAEYAAGRREMLDRAMLTALNARG